MKYNITGFVETNGSDSIDVSKLRDGMVFKSYPAYVRYMGIKQYKSNSNGQIKQFKELSRVCEWKKGAVIDGKFVKNAIVIIKVYKEKKPSIDKRKTRNETKLSRLVCKSMLDMLKKNQVDSDTQFGVPSSFYISERDLKHELGLKNSSYDQCKRLKEPLANHLSIPLTQIEDFFQLTDDVIRKTIDSAYKTLENQRCAIARKTKQLVFESETLDDGSRLVIPTTYATDEQYKFIFAVEGVVLSKYGISRISLVHQKDEKLKNQFYKDVIDMIRRTAPEHHPELAKLKYLKFYCSAVELSYFEERVDYIIKQNGSLTQEEKVELGEYVLEEFIKNLEVSLKSSIEDINKEMARRSQINATRNHNRALKNEGKLIECRKNDDYVGNMITLINALIDKTNPVNINALKTGKSK